MSEQLEMFPDDHYEQEVTGQEVIESYCQVYEGRLAELAWRLDVNPRTLRRYRSGERAVPATTVELLRRLWPRVEGGKLPPKL